jgi:hypothetical protein
MESEKSERNGGESMKWERDVVLLRYSAFKTRGSDLATLGTLAYRHILRLLRIMN